MEKAFYEVYDFSLKRKLDMRNAALALAVGRVAQAMKLRGVYPEKGDYEYPGHTWGAVDSIEHVGRLQ